MHRFSLLVVALAVCLVGSVALAANDRVTATFETLAASGITGTADLNPNPQGGVQIHGTLRGLEPGVQYMSVIYQQGSTCGAGVPTTEAARFVANPAGNANFNSKVPLQLTQIGSISVQRVSDSSLLACAAVTP